ncbi:MAG: Rrf2 family transcriptional regulator, partial [Candidatus Omnitrophica bacterium]|nr:Rrf2 family transcriptional regulator [Candidatus Omnitrophota bacterium]
MRRYQVKLITRDTDYAIRALSCIAGSPGRKANVSELVEELGIPRPFLRKILQALNRAGVLDSVRGKGGGFTLRVPAHELSVFDIMGIFQGDFVMNEHIFKGKVCPRMKVCRLKNELDSIEAEVTERLKG